jgi:hypothetical protein
MNLALEIATTPLGWDDDRMSGLWNARADVTRGSAKLWIIFVDAITKAESAVTPHPFGVWNTRPCKKRKDGAPTVLGLQQFGRWAGEH